MGHWKQDPTYPPSERFLTSYHHHPLFCPAGLLVSKRPDWPWLPKGFKSRHTDWPRSPLGVVAVGDAVHFKDLVYKVPYVGIGDTSQTLLVLKGE